MQAEDNCSADLDLQVQQEVTVKTEEKEKFNSVSEIIVL